MMRYWSSQVEKAIRVSSAAHHGQVRKGSSLPYFLHPVAVALILIRAGFDDDDILSAAILHDTLEDTEATVEQLHAEFPGRVCAIVEGASERKLDSNGEPRPWNDRKREHIERVRRAALDVRAVVLADKLHNLHSISVDVERLEPVWSRFNAPKADVLWYHEEIVSAACNGGDASALDCRLANLADECRELIKSFR